MKEEVIQNAAPVSGRSTGASAAPRLRKEYTSRRNINRAYMKLDVWQRGVDLFKLAFQMAGQTRDWKLRLQFVDAVQSVSANVAEGYGRRTLPEYLQFLYIAKGSLAESLTRAIGLSEARLISTENFQEFDELHYEVENKLLQLINSLESKSSAAGWRTTLPSREIASVAVPVGGTPLSQAGHTHGEPLTPQVGNGTFNRQPLGPNQQSSNSSIQKSR